MQQQSYQQYRSQLPNSNPPLAIKQEAFSNQTRNNNRPMQNVNMHEESEYTPESAEQPQYANQNFPHHGMAHVSTSEPNVDFADAVLDTSDVRQ